MLLDQYGAADVLVPEVILHRQWPGGPVVDQFFARHGPDHKLLGSFVLSASNGDREGLAALLDKGVERIDAIYVDALRSGRLHTSLGGGRRALPQRMAGPLANRRRARGARDPGAGLICSRSARKAGTTRCMT